MRPGDAGERALPNRDHRHQVKQRRSSRKADVGGEKTADPRCSPARKTLFFVYDGWIQRLDRQARISANGQTIISVGLHDRRRQEAHRPMFMCSTSKTLSEKSFTNGTDGTLYRCRTSQFAKTCTGFPLRRSPIPIPVEVPRPNTATSWRTPRENGRPYEGPSPKFFTNAHQGD